MMYASTTFLVKERDVFRLHRTDKRMSIWTHHARAEDKVTPVELGDTN